MAFIKCNYYSEVLQLHSSMHVILPEPVQTEKYPVLWLLHGLSDDHSIWTRRTSIERYASTRGLAVVLPAVNRSFYQDMHHGLNYNTFMRKELPHIARGFFPISDDPDKNFIAGLSMGGYGAFLLAMQDPQNFAAAASLSGALNITGHMEDEEKRIEEQEIVSMFGNYREQESNKYDLLKISAELIEAGQKLPRLFACCGTEDFLYQDNLVFRDHAIKHGIDLTYEEGPGDHEWEYWDIMIQRILNWLPLPEKETI